MGAVFQIGGDMENNGNLGRMRAKRNKCDMVNISELFKNYEEIKADVEKLKARLEKLETKKAPVKRGKKDA